MRGGDGAEYCQSLVIQGKVRISESLLLVLGSHWKVVSRERILSGCISKGSLHLRDLLKATYDGILDECGIS